MLRESFIKSKRKLKPESISLSILVVGVKDVGKSLLISKLLVIKPPNQNYKTKN